MGERHTVDVCVEGVQPLLLVQLRDAVHDHLVSVVVEQDVDPAHLLDSLIDNLLAVLLALEVRGVQVALLPVLLDRLLRLLRVLLFLGQVCDEGVCALHGEEDSCGSPNA